MTDEVTYWQEFKKGIVQENPLLVLMVGLCSALAVSNSVENGIFMGFAATFVLVCSNVLVSSIRRWTPAQVRIPTFIVIIASFVTIVDLTMKAYFPAVYESLGVWIPLIVVNCMILARAEGFAYKKPVLRSALDGLGTGVGYTLVLLVMGFVRELLGTGRIVLFDRTLVSLGPFNPPVIFVLFPGAFLTFAFLMAVLNRVQARRKG